MKATLSNFVEAFQIFLKYGDITYPTHCEHDVLTVCVKPTKVSKEDKKRLNELGFNEDEDEDCFRSYRYGSA